LDDAGRENCAPVAVGGRGATYSSLQRRPHRQTAPPEAPGATIAQYLELGRRLLGEPPGHAERAAAGGLVGRPLLRRAVAAGEELLDEGELVDAAEAARGRLGELGEREHRVPRGALLVAGEVDEIGLEPVAHGAPLVLGDQRHGLDRQRALALVPLRERRDEALHERDERADGLEPCLRVADPDLDRAEPWMRAQVPP